MSLRFKPLELPEVLLLETNFFGDERGHFWELFKESGFRKTGIRDTFVQINVSRSSRNIVRGLHYQKAPQAQGKLIAVLSGGIFDVAVDLRKGSPTFGRWTGAELTGQNHQMLFVPQGFAHGFCTLTDHADVFYYCTNEYSPEHERGVRWDDPRLAIRWPVSCPQLSDRDQALPFMDEADNNFVY